MSFSNDLFAKRVISDLCRRLYEKLNAGGHLLVPKGEDYYLLLNSFDSIIKYAYFSSGRSSDWFKMHKKIDK